MEFIGCDLASPIGAALLSAWQPLCMAVLALSAICGAIAMASPQRFRAIAVYSARWIETERISKWLDRRIDIDGYVLRHPRTFGAIATLSALYLAYCLAG